MATTYNASPSVVVWSSGGRKRPEREEFVSYDVDVIRKCEECGHCDVLWESNYTWNVGPMLHDVGLHLNDLPRPYEAGEFVKLLADGIAKLESDPAKYEAMNPENGWGSYSTMLKWLRGMLHACVTHPDATVEIY